MKKIFMSVMIALLLPFAVMLTGCFGNDKEYRIDIEHVNNINIYCDFSEAKEGDEITLYYDSVENGYKFLYFTLNGEKLEGDTFTMPGEDVTISAVINKVRYTITYHIDSDTKFKDNVVAPTTYTMGSATEIPDAVKTGFIFNGWYRDSNFEEKFNVIWAGMYGNIDLYPKFDIISYQIRYHNIENASHTNPKNYNCLSGSISLTNATKQDFEFKGWYDNETFTGNKITTIPAGTTGTINLYAKFISTKVDSDGYRLITNAVDFMEIIPENLDGKYRLKGNISFEGYEYTPIGDKKNPFTGELDCASGDIRYISITSMDEYTGLFGYIKNATITGVSIIDIDISIPSNIGFMEYIGALAGYAENCIIDDIYIAYADIDVRVWSCYVGSIFGYVKNSTISNCEVGYSPIKVLATQQIYAGGICGQASSSTISKCSVDFMSSTNVELNSQTQNGKIYYGGLVGESYSTNINNSYVWQENSKIETTLLGKTSSSFVGGLVGYLDYSSVIENTYALLVKIQCFDDFASTDTDGDMYLGGLVGQAYNNATIKNSFLTTYKDRSSRSLTLTCGDYKGCIVGNAKNTSLITNIFVDSEITFVGGISSLWYSAYVTTNTLSSIKTTLNWDTSIWNLNFYGKNIGPILR